MWVKMQHSIFKISNNGKDLINLANLLSLWCTPLSSRGVLGSIYRFFLKYGKPLESLCEYSRILKRLLCKTAE